MVTGIATRETEQTTVVSLQLSESDARALASAPAGQLSLVAIAGGDSIRCAPYAPFGTEELAHAAARALSGRRACLLANHGAVAAGATLQAALDLMTEIEELATQYCVALQIGSVTLLSHEEMAEIIERFKTYGQR